MRRDASSATLHRILLRLRRTGCPPLPLLPVSIPTRLYWNITQKSAPLLCRRCCELVCTKGTASAVPSGACSHEGFSPRGTCFQSRKPYFSFEKVWLLEK